MGSPQWWLSSTGVWTLVPPGLVPYPEDSRTPCPFRLLLWLPLHCHAGWAVVLFLRLHLSRLKKGDIMGTHFYVPWSKFITNAQVLIRLRCQPHSLGNLGYVISFPLPSPMLTQQIPAEQEVCASVTCVLGLLGASASAPIVWRLGPHHWFSAAVFTPNLHFIKWSHSLWYTEKLSQVGEKTVDGQLAAEEFYYYNPELNFSLPRLLGSVSLTCRKKSMEGVVNCWTSCSLRCSLALTFSESCN